MILKNARIISPKNNIDGVFDIETKDRIILKIGKIDSCGIDLTGKIVAPGFIDMHCHLREPGFEYKETIETGVESALAGGYTAICPMANTHPKVDSIETLKYTIDKANGIGFFPFAALSKKFEGKELTDFEALLEAGAIGFSDDGVPVINMKLLEEALKKKVLISSHSEDYGYKDMPESEYLTVKKELDVVKKLGARYHFAHISTKESIELIRQAKKEGLKVTCETAPHYFVFDKSMVNPENGIYKVNPPLREKADIEAVIEGLKDGTIDAIATDHAPHLIEEKLKPFGKSPYGFTGFETAIGLTFTYLKDYLSFSEIISKFTVNPAKILKLEDYGTIEEGKKANLTIIDPDFEWVVKAQDFKSKCKISPFEGMKLKGKPVATVIEGKYNEI